MKHLFQKTTVPGLRQNYLVSTIRLLFSACIGLGIFSTCVCYSAPIGPVLISGAPTDLFYSMGVDGTGTVVIPGRHGNVEGLFESVDGNLVFRKPSGGIIAERGTVVSRDGHYLAAKLENGPPELLERPALSIQSLSDSGWDTVNWVSTVQGQPVVGGSIISGFTSLPATWSPARGFRDLSTLWGLGSILTCGSSEGQMVGTGSRLGEPVILYGSQTNCSVLHGQGNDNFDVTAFSPNGRFITADFGRTVFSQAVLWTNLTPSLLAQPDDEPARATSAVSDSGFIAGQGRSLSGVNPRDGSAFLFDPAIGRAEWFDDWWAARPSAPALQATITRITDLYEANGSLYCLLETVDQGPMLAIAPLAQTQAPMLLIEKSANGGVQLRWSSAQTWIVETTASLLDHWSPLPGQPVVSGTEYSLDLPASDQARFFRIKAQ